jgi:cysteinyl-tRNA synthetase
MSMHYLGDTLDIHTGGIDHISIHHTNEIAQAEAATGKTFVNYWVHTAFLNVDQTKMSKSLGNLFTLDDLKERGYTPLALRYHFLGSSYRKALNFSWEGLEGAQRALMRIWEMCNELPPPSNEPLEEYLERFEDAIADDMNTAQALAVLIEMLRSDGTPDRKAATVILMDGVLGLDLANARTRLSDAWRYRGIKAEMEVEARALAAKRKELRGEKRYEEADRLRDEILAMGFQVEDTPDGPRVRPALPEEREGE